MSPRGVGGKESWENSRENACHLLACRETTLPGRTVHIIAVCTLTCKCRPTQCGGGADVLSRALEHNNSITTSRISEYAVRVARRAKGRRCENKDHALYTLTCSEITSEEMAG